MPLWAFWVVYAVACFALVFVNFSRNSLSLFRMVSSLWMAVFFCLFCLLAASDFIRLFLFIIGKRIPDLQFYAVGGSIFMCVILIVFGMLNARSIKTVNYEINLHGSGSGFRIALVSDLHIGNTVNKAWIDRVAAQVNKAKPDMVCVAGDVFDGNVDVIQDLQGVISSLAEMKAPLGVYACFGNHDVDRAHGNTERMKNIVKAAGVFILQDEALKIRDNLYIAGRRDARPIGMNARRKTAAQICDELDGTVIMLDHQPVDFALLEQAGVDLLFCGHTHRGQVFPATLITRQLFKKLGSTHYGYWKGQTMQAVVTSGAGVWGPPLRLGTNSEVVIIDVNFML